MRTPTPEQQAVLDSTARVRIVRAAPGSGKTWLVAELIRKELAGSPSSGGGIAALSFTRVGGKEIRQALGYDLGHPHFVGTIDAFLFRYVVRPFLQRARPGHEAPRLIPADWAPRHWSKAPNGGNWQYRRSGDAHVPIYDLFEICFVDEDATGPVLAHPLRYGRGMERIPANDRAGVLGAKRNCWQRLGWITHADAALLATELLSDPVHGTAIKSVLLRRFPLLIVDELQDTGFFLGKCIRLMLEEPSARGALVGDPDQAIYEWNGARPDLFNVFMGIPGATVLPLARSRRCPASVTACASQLKQTAGQIEPIEGDSGRAFIVQYADMVPDAKRLVQAIRAGRPGANVKVVVRWNSTIREFTVGAGDEVLSLRCPVLSHVARAVQAFRRGQQVQALASARAALELAIAGQEGITDEQIAGKGIDVRDWKALAVRCLLNCNGLDSSLSMHNWQISAGRVIDDAVQAFAHPATASFQTGKLKPHNLTGTKRTKAKADQAFADFAPVVVANAGVLDLLIVETVHAVKGETHDVTVFVCPPESRNRPCPSVAWWPNDPLAGEERRIAYVAITRTRSDLVVCVSDACYQRLLNDRPTFVGAFQCKTVDEYIAAFAATGTPLCPSGADA